MPLPPPRIGPRTIIAVDGGIDLPSGNADTDPGGQIHTQRCKQSSLRTKNMRQALVVVAAIRLTCDTTGSPSSSRTTEKRWNLTAFRQSVCY
jgi:hypothetical protein